MFYVIAYKMTTETLSDKLRMNGGTNREHIRDVREFIQKLKVRLFKYPFNQDGLHYAIREEIDKLAGEELLIPVSSTPFGSANHSPQEEKAIGRALQSKSNKRDMGTLEDNHDKLANHSPQQNLRAKVENPTEDNHDKKGCGKFMFWHYGQRVNCGNFIIGETQLCSECSKKGVKND